MMGVVVDKEGPPYRALQHIKGQCRGGHALYMEEQKEEEGDETACKKMKVARTLSSWHFVGARGGFPHPTRPHPSLKGTGSSLH